MSHRDAPSRASLPELAAALRSGGRAPEVYLADLETRFAEREPGVLAFMPEPGRWDRVRRDLERLLARYPDPADRPPLFGVPVGVKDIFHVDGLPTTGGSRLPPEILTGRQADSVSRLKSAGAIVLGKTVSTEFAYFGPGPTRNPHNPGHTPGGSSSGSAAAVAAGLCPLALGTQTIGSIVRPASFCGVAGFKPTYERVSRAGVIPLAPSLDHVGPFAADAAGLRLAASILIDDWHPRPLERRPVLGVPEGPYLTSAGSEMQAHFQATCERLSGAGYSIVPAAVMPDFEEIRERHNLLVAAEAAQVHAQWFMEYRSLYQAKTAELIERGQAVNEAQVRAARAGRVKLLDELTRAMNAQSIDVWICPAAPGSAPAGLESTGNPVMNLPWTHAGLPSVNLPSGLAADGLPLGLQLVGGWNADEDLLKWAEGLERVLREA